MQVQVGLSRTRERPVPLYTQDPAGYTWDAGPSGNAVAADLLAVPSGPLTTGLSLSALDRRAVDPGPGYTWAISDTGPTMEPGARAYLGSQNPGLLWNPEIG